MNLRNTTIDINTAADNEIIAAQGAGNSIRIHRIALFNGVATAQAVTLKDGSTALTGPIDIPSSVGGGFILADNPSSSPWWVLSSNAAFNINLSAATQVTGFVQWSLG